MGDPRFFSHEPRNHLRTKASLAAIDKLLHQMMDNHRYPRNSTILLMAKIRRSPVEVGSLSHYRVLAPSKQWLGMGFLKHQPYLLTIPTWTRGAWLAHQQIASNSGFRGFGCRDLHCTTTQVCLIKPNKHEPKKTSIRSCRLMTNHLENLFCLVFEYFILMRIGIERAKKHPISVTKKNPRTTFEYWWNLSCWTRIQFVFMTAPDPPDPRTKTISMYLQEWYTFHRMDLETINYII